MITSNLYAVLGYFKVLQQRLKKSLKKLLLFCM